LVAAAELADAGLRVGGADTTSLRDVQAARFASLTAPGFAGPTPSASLRELRESRPLRVRRAALRAALG
ncbi:hypothetical protein ACWD4J_42730, partial [Streptomyces sp. NPDC002577]